MISATKCNSDTKVSKKLSYNIFAKCSKVIVSAIRRRRDIKIPLCLSALVRKSLI